MLQLLKWCAVTPSLYYTTALGSLALFASLALYRGERENTLRFEWMFLATMAVTFFAWRWPIFLWPDPINIDEATFTAGAMRAARIDFAPWRGFDCVTSGPLNAYILTLPALIRTRIDFFSTRVIGVCLLIGTSGALYLALKWTFGRRVARISIVPPVTLLSLTTSPDFVHFSSEHFPIFLTTAALTASAFLLRSNTREGHRLFACAVGGICAGSAPFAKLQAAPMAVANILFLAAAVFLMQRETRRTSRKEVLVLMLSLIAMPVLLALSLTFTREWNYALTSYVKSAFVYIHDGAAIGPAFFVQRSKLYGAFLIGALLTLLIGGGALLITRRRVSSRGLALEGCALLFLLTAFCAIYTPHRPFPHYLLLSVVPLSGCLGVTLGLAREVDLWREQDWLSPAAFLGCFIVPALSIMWLTPQPYLNARPAEGWRRQNAAIARYAKRGARISVWGWMPQYYIRTGTISATRQVEMERLIRPGPYREYLRSCYLNDLRKGAPRLFVDAVAPGAYDFTDRATQGLESFPALEAFVRMHYTLRENLDGLRIFVRQDREAVAEN